VTLAASQPRKGTWRDYSPEEKQRAHRERANVQLEFARFKQSRGWVSPGAG
jgi:hypothetical protein